MTKMIGIVGTRRRDSSDDYGLVLQAFKDVYESTDIIVTGGCPKGADAFAVQIARDLNVPIQTHYPDWQRYGRTAGLTRNTLIAQDADVLIACVAPDRRGGTEDTIRKFQALGKTDVILVL